MRSKCCFWRRHASRTKPAHGTIWPGWRNFANDGRTRNATGATSWRSMTVDGRSTWPWPAHSGNWDVLMRRNRCCFQRRNVFPTEPIRGTIWRGSRGRASDGWRRNCTGAASRHSMTIIGWSISRWRGHCVNKDTWIRRSKRCFRPRRNSRTRLILGTIWPGWRNRASDGRMRNGTGAASWHSTTEIAGPGRPWRGRCASKGIWTRRSKCCSRRRNVSRMQPKRGTIWPGRRSPANGGRMRNGTGVASWPSMTVIGKCIWPWRARCANKEPWIRRSRRCSPRRHASRTKPNFGAIWPDWQ